MDDEELSEDEKTIFDAIINDDNMVLIRGTFRGKKAAYIAATVLDNGNTALLPLALLLDRKTAELLKEDIRGPGGTEGKLSTAVVGIGVDEAIEMATQEQERKRKEN